MGGVPLCLFGQGKGCHSFPRGQPDPSPCPHGQGYPAAGSPLREQRDLRYPSGDRASLKRGIRQPSSPLKFTIGLFFLALAFSLMIPAAKLALAGRVSPLWLLGLYFLQTVGEMFLSPVGLSTFTKLAPRHLVGVMLGIWYLGSAFGNKFAGVLAASFGEGNADNLDRFFGQQALAVLIIAGIFLTLVPWVRRRMGGVT